MISPKVPLSNVPSRKFLPAIFIFDVNITWINEPYFETIRFPNGYLIISCHFTSSQDFY
nr:MAG TPA: hypothetical protein [Caudoviricetes sp.]